MSMKKCWILRWFQIRGNNLKKVYLEKVICEKLLQVSSIEEDKLQFCTLLLPVTFLLAHFLHFSQQFRNQRKILSCFDTHIQILWRKSFYVKLALFWNLKALFARNGSKCWKTCLQKCLRIAFYTFIPMNPYHSLKKHHNRCTLLGTIGHNSTTWVYRSILSKIVFRFNAIRFFFVSTSRNVRQRKLNAVSNGRS